MGCSLGIASSIPSPSGITSGEKPRVEAFEHFSEKQKILTLKDSIFQSEVVQLRGLREGPRKPSVADKISPPDLAAIGT